MGELTGVLLAIVSSSLGGTAAAVTRYLTGDADPLTLAILRWGIGILVVLPTALVLRVRWPSRADLLPVGALGICFFGLFFILYNIAVGYTTAARASLALSTLSLTAALLAACSNGSSSGSGVKDAGPVAAADPVAAFEALQGYFVTTKLQMPAAPATPTAPLTGLTITVEAWVSDSMDAAALHLSPAGGADEVTPQVAGKAYASPAEMPAALGEQAKAAGLSYPVHVYLFHPQGLGSEISVMAGHSADGSAPQLLVKPMDCDPVSGIGC